MRQCILFLGFFCLAATAPASGNENLHELMSDEEAMQVFRTHRHAIPKYEVVPVHWSKQHKRSQDSTVRIQLKAFDSDIELWLNSTDGILIGKDTPVYIATSRPPYYTHIDSITQLQDPMAGIGKLMEDIDNKATVVITKAASGRNTISGIIGSKGLVVEPLPNRIHDHYSDRLRRSANYTENLQNSNNEVDEPHYHVVYKQPEHGPKTKYASMSLAEEVIIHQSDNLRETNPDVVYPEVLVFVDYTNYRLYGNKLDTFLTYMLLFWNGVDLKYRSLEKPKIRFNIVGIIIGDNAHAFPFIKKNVFPRNNQYVCAQQAVMDIPAYLNQLEKWDANRFSRKSYDIAVAIGPYEMCKVTPIECGYFGFAYIGGACSQRNTGMIMDSGVFDGVHTTAHELAHLLGVNHDGEGNECLETDGYIMAPNQIKSNHTAEWSSCSVRQFDMFFRSLSNFNSHCLFNEPKTTDPLPRVMPGRTMTRDQQCKRITGMGACKFGPEEKDVCEVLRCEMMDGEKKICDPSPNMSNFAPLDGTECGNGMICFHGKCVSDPNIL